ncbi:MAG: hypothetical protein H7Y30_06440 [Pyrinomonadaceae bacterium]|nr:hypothetical protein [Pyrinomonadaceae bacterium]
MSEDTTQNMQQNGSFEDRVFARFDSLDARMQRFDERLQALEIQAERRALETKPIWERALAEIVEVKGEIVEVKERLTNLEQLVRPMVRKVDILSRDMITLRAEQEGLEDRVEKLESKPV